MESCEAAFWESMDELVPIFEREAINLHIEPHPEDFVETIQPAVDMIRSINSKNVRFLYCAPHTFHFGDDMAKMIEEAAPLIETENGVLADVEIFVSAQFGYQVTTEAVFEKGIVNISEDTGPCIRSAGRWGSEVTPGFVERFRNAFDLEVQSWVNAAKRGEIGGPSSWDGYAAAACCEAGVAAQKSGEKIAVSLRSKPDMYR